MLRFLLLSCTFAAGANAYSADCRSVSYEPASVTLKGKVLISSSRHPNGTALTSPILRLESPVTVEPSAQADPVNVRERCVREIQLSSPSPDLHSGLLRLGTQVVAVTGTLFHEHTAWHVRKIVMQVQSIDKQQIDNRRTQ
jgi:hypothetical protein